MSKEQKITTDIKVPNKDLEALRLNFPHCFDKDGNFQLEKFKNNLTEKEINFSTESYGIDWLGKSYARLLASDPATTLLKADETHNSKPENTNAENLLIKGDNLEVLKHLANAYYEQVKMIYIDPPYNTGSDGFVYNDDRKFTARELQNLIGVDAEKAKRILSFTQSNSNSHSAWLTFMYPRLYIAKQLLKDDGVIFISIDDNEVAQLRLLMDEVFGEENFVNEFIWVNNSAGRQIQGIGAASTKEYILCYSKKIDNLNEFFIDIEFAKKEMPNIYKGFNFEIKNDHKGEYVITHELNNGNSSFNELTRKNLVFDIFYNEDENEVRFGEVNSDIPEGFTRISPKNIIGKKENHYAWRWEKDKIKKDIDDLEFVKFKNTYRIYTKRRDFKRTTLKDLITNINTINGTNDLKTLNLENYFSYPKPITLIKILINLIEKENDLILDFFAGSGTTGDAVMQLNAEDGGNRKFILVQLPEPIDPKKNKTAYDFVKNELKAEPTIFEITKERLIRSAKKINEQIDLRTKDLEAKLTKLKMELQTDETKVAVKNLQVQIAQNSKLKSQNNFKIFETTPIWEDYDFEAEQFDPTQTLFDIGKLSDDDVKALLTTWKTYDGIPLTQELEKIDLSGYTAYYGNGKLYLMDKGFTTDNLKNLLEKIDADKKFSPTSIIAFGYHFESKNLRELSENVKSYANKKNIDIDFITRY
jgi:adenine-specific DNA-methyltransferase